MARLMTPRPRLQLLAVLAGTAIAQLQGGHIAHAHLHHRRSVDPSLSGSASTSASASSGLPSLAAAVSNSVPLTASSAPFPLGNSTIQSIMSTGAATLIETHTTINMVTVTSYREPGALATEISAPVLVAVQKDVVDAADGSTTSAVDTAATTDDPPAPVINPNNASPDAAETDCDTASAVSTPGATTPAAVADPTPDSDSAVTVHPAPAAPSPKPTTSSSAVCIYSTSTLTNTVTVTAPVDAQTSGAGGSGSGGSYDSSNGSSDSSSGGSGSNSSGGSGDDSLGASNDSTSGKSSDNNTKASSGNTPTKTSVISSSAASSSPQVTQDGQPGGYGGGHTSSPASPATKTTKTSEPPKISSEKPKISSEASPNNNAQPSYGNSPNTSAPPASPASSDPTKASSAPTAAPAASSAAPNNCKRAASSKKGCMQPVAGGNDGCIKLQAKGAGFSWFANWESIPKCDPQGLQFIPQINKLDGGELQNAFLTETDFSAPFIMNVNEPWYNGVSTERLVAFLPTFNSKAGSSKTLSPAITSDVKDIKNLRDFYNQAEAIGQKPFDIINGHYYANCVAGETGGDPLKTWLGKLKQEFPGKQMWITEFACNPYEKGTRTDEMHSDFMAAAMKVLEADNTVDRYAWWQAEDNAYDAGLASGGWLLNGTLPSQLGLEYIAGGQC